MGYVRPLYDADYASWSGRDPYTRPVHSAAHASWYEGGPSVDIVAGTLAAALAPPTLPATVAADGDMVQVADAAISLPAPELPLMAILRERPYIITAAISLPAPTLPIAAQVAGDMVQAVESGIALPVPTLPAPSLTAAGYQQIDLPEITEGQGIATSDAVMTSLGARHRAGVTIGTGRTVTQQQMQDHRTPALVPTAEMEPLRIASVLVTHEAIRVHRGAMQLAQEAARTASSSAVPHAEAARIRIGAHERAHPAMRCVYGASAPYAEAVRRRGNGRALHRHGIPCAVPRSATHADTLRAHTSSLHPWGQGIPPPPGRWWPFELLYCITFAGKTPYTRPAHDAAHARFQEPYTRPPAICRRYGWQPIGPEPPPDKQPIIIPIRRVYLVVNSFALVRADTGMPLPSASFSASLSSDSWCWTWSARVDATLLPHVRPIDGEPVEVVATINGTPLRLLVERIQRDRRLGSAWLNISGRSRSAYLSAPYAAPESRTNADLRTAQQLLADALTFNGVPLGWTVDWRIEDWPVPAGAWSHTGTYIEAALRIAEAGGAYIQTHNTADRLIVLPRYPSAPWEWPDAPPDLVLPEDVVEVEGIEWTEKPSHNAVWIIGGAGGRADMIRMTGTIGDRRAQTIVDPLATDPIMTRQRGLPVLADTGRQAHISLRLPVLQETGLIRPGALVQYTESGNTHHGLSRSVEVTMDYPQLWQTVRVETHEQPL